MARQFSRLNTTIPKPLNTACATNRIGAVNRKENSMGSVTPAIKEVNAAGIRIALIFVRFSGLAVWYIARHAPTRPNILESPLASHTTEADNIATFGSAISA